MFDSIETKIHDPKVLAALLKVPRSNFVPREYGYLAEEDRPLSIGYNQTISQPLVVAMMTELLELTGKERILEIGTGSGYQTAILAELAREVFSLEVIAALSRQGQQTLADLGYRNIRFRIGDGFHGWAEYAPYEGILVAAAAREVPGPLVEQLADGGRLVIPLGEPDGIQTLWRLKKNGNQLVREDYGAVRFVPFVGGVKEKDDLN